jgi:hypothetical protein
LVAEQERVIDADQLDYKEFFLSFATYALHAVTSRRNEQYQA